MPTNHGINVTELDTALTTPSVAESGIPFIVGVAPVHSAAHPAPAGAPVLITSWTEALDKLGYFSSDLWSTFTLCEAMYSQFQGRVGNRRAGRGRPACSRAGENRQESRRPQDRHGKPRP